MPDARLGIDAYSVRAWRWKALQLIDYAAAQGARALQVSLADLESTDSAHLAKVRDAARAKDVYLDTAIGCFCPSAQQWNQANGTPGDYLTKSIEITKGLGAKVMRVFAGSIGDRSGRTPMEQHIENCFNALRSAKTAAEANGVKIAVENHGEFTARELKSLVEDAGKSYVGVTLDTGNPMWVLEDPLLTVEILGPIAASSHLRDSVLFEHPRGAAFQWVAIGDGQLPIAACVKRLRELAPDAPLQLEIITGRPPQMLPYFEESYWRAFRKLPAPDFARFMALVKKGRPFEGHMVIAGTGAQPPEIEAALKLQQKTDLERSLAAMKKILSQT